MESHPDRNPGDAKAQARFLEVQKAFEFLSDRNTHMAYRLSLNLPVGNNPFEVRTAETSNDAKKLRELLDDLYAAYLTEGEAKVLFSTEPYDEAALQREALRKMVEVVSSFKRLRTDDGRAVVVGTHQEFSRRWD